MKILITCEHGGNVIPPAYHAFFQHQQQALNSHRGYDPGTLDLFEEVEFLADFSLKSEVSRLLVELNRSLHHRQLFSEVSKEFSAEKKRRNTSAILLSLSKFNRRTDRNLDSFP